jgi:Protein of unknown function, DUF594/Domain of unknown function (DUF4220)
MLRRRFAKLPLDEAGSPKALNFVLQGLIDYIGNNEDIQTDGSNGRGAPSQRVFSIIRAELKFVSDFLNMKIPIYYYFDYKYALVDIFGVFITIGSYIYISTGTSSATWLSLLVQDSYSQCFSHILRHGSVVVRLFSALDQTITAFLVTGCIYIQCTGMLMSRSWSDLRYVKEYIEDTIDCDPLFKLRRFTFHRKVRPKKACTILDTKAETILLSIKVNVSILARLPKWIRRKVPRDIPIVQDHGTAVKEAILKFMRSSKCQLSNGETSLRNHYMEHLNWASRPNGSTTEVILVWHIAATLFDHQEFSSEQNIESQQEPSIQQNHEDSFKEVALELSNYCHHLVVYFPELLPDEPEWTEDIYKSVIKDILAIDRSSGQEPTRKGRCKALLQAMRSRSSLDEESTSSVVEKGTKLAMDLINCPQDGALVWKMLADFWVEMILFIAPSDNVEGHKKVLHRGELITQLWALLTHAGILTRPKPTEHHDHVRENNEITGDVIV